MRIQDVEWNKIAAIKPQHMMLCLIDQTILGGQSEKKTNDLASNKQKRASHLYPKINKMCNFLCLDSRASCCFPTPSCAARGREG